AELDAWFAKIKPQVGGKIVLVGRPTFIDQSKEPTPKHLADDTARKMVDPANANVAGRGRGNGFTPTTPRPGALTGAQVGEQLGTDKRDEVIMLGGHLDSWHSATGATDNAIGCATMMEAARILKAIHAPLRRTVRVACWSGEEEGLLGSKAYVAQHFGTA